MFKFLKIVNKYIFVSVLSFSLFSLVNAAKKTTYDGYVAPSCAGGCWGSSSGPQTSGFIRELLHKYATDNEVDVGSMYKSKVGGFDATDRKLVMDLQRKYNELNPDKKIAVDEYWGRQTADAFKREFEKTDAGKSFVADTLKSYRDFERLKDGGTIQKQLRQAGYEYNRSSGVWENKAAIDTNVTGKSELLNAFGVAAKGNQDNTLEAINSLPSEVQSDANTYFSNLNLSIGQNEVAKSILESTARDLNTCTTSECMKEVLGMGNNKYLTDKFLDFYEQASKAKTEAERDKIYAEANKYFDKIDGSAKDSIKRNFDSYKDYLKGATPEQIKALREELKDCKDLHCTANVYDRAISGDWDSPAKDYDPNKGTGTAKVNKVTECKGGVFDAAGVLVKDSNKPGQIRSFVQMEALKKGMPTTFLQDQRVKPADKLNPNDKFVAGPYKDSPDGNKPVQGITRAQGARGNTTYTCCEKADPTNPGKCVKKAGTTSFFGSVTKAK
jgi:hypothetical protein